MKVRHILCATDFSDFSARAIEHATALAKSYGASLAIAHIHPFMGTFNSASPYIPSGLPLDEAGRARLLGMVDQVAAPSRAAGVKTEPVLLEGDPAEEVLRQARTTPTDLIVVGTHGRRGFDRWMLGSVAARVVQRAACPVLAVPRPPEGTAPAAPPYRNVLCAADLWTSEPVMEAALSVAGAAGGRVTMLHVLEDVPATETMARTARIDWADFLDLVEKDARTRLRQAVERVGIEVPVEEVVATGKPYREIVDVAIARKADLVVMGVHGRNALERISVGSTAQHVLRLAPCPTLTVRAPMEPRR